MWRVLSQAAAPDQINAITKKYADNETLNWLDIGHVFLNEDGTLKREIMPDAAFLRVSQFPAAVEHTTNIEASPSSPRGLSDRRVKAHLHFRHR